jgi:U3 small nucleolar RNA-associated protein 4
MEFRYPSLDLSFWTTNRTFKISGGFVVLQEVVESMGGSVWQLAAEHTTRVQKKTMSNGVLQSTGSSKEDEGSSDSEDVSISGSEDEQHTENREQQVALACEDGCVRIFAVADMQPGMLYRQSLPRIKGRVLSVAWTWDGTQVLAGGSDGFFRSLFA